MRIPEIVSTSVYHVYNRGVDKRRIFTCRKDYQRFLESLYLFNDRKYHRLGGDPVLRMSALASIDVTESVREPLVQVIAFVLMPNHFHLALRQLVPGGISKYLQRLGISHTKYFNLKHKRTGRLFESTFKAKPLDLEQHLIHLPRYIHLNALDGSVCDWRNGRVKDWSKAKRILNEYPWSSHHAYLGKSYGLPIIDEEFVKQHFKNTKSYWDYLRHWTDRNIPVFDMEVED